MVGVMTPNAADIHVYTSRGRGLCIRLQELCIEWRVTSLPTILHTILEGLLQAPFELPLRRLEWLSSGPEAKWTMLSEISRRAAETLDEYVIRSTHDGWLSKTDISRHRSLKVLSVVFLFMPRNLNRWPSIPMFISNLKSRNIRELKFYFDDIGNSFHWGFIDWNEMNDALLSLHERYPSMKITFLYRSPPQRAAPGPNRAAGDLGSLSALLRPVLETNIELSVVHQDEAALRP